jgi:uncharacterized membrane protein YgdD (TMEM256/DUF423 family)
MHHSLRLSAILGGTAVLLGTFAAHGLKGRLDDRDLAVFETGVRYQMFTALALLACAALAGHGVKVRAAGRALFAGAAIFSGSLYLLTTTGQTWLGAITPVGGVLMVLGWVLLFAAAKPPAAGG